VIARCVRRCRPLALVGALALGCRGDAPAKSVVELSIADPARHWVEAGFVELVPAIRPPSTPDERDRITVWIRLPGAARITSAPSAAGGMTLAVPPETVADRVEYITPTGASPDAPATGNVIDVRGTRFVPGGAELFHVLRPGTGAGLRGFEWPRHDQGASEQATRRLIDSQRALGASPAQLRRLRRLNDCAACHRPDVPAATRVTRDLPRRPTDATGLYSLLAVMRNEAPVEVHRPRDMNADDPFISVVCPGNQPATLDRESNGARRFTCPGGAVPTARLDVTAAIAAGDPHALAVCRSRRMLYERMTEGARRAFSGAMAGCP
jgi:hypothetical protein